MSTSKIVGIDMGATKIHAGVVQGGKVLQEVKFPTSAQVSQEQIIAKLMQGVAPLVDAGVVGIGIGVPGLVDEANGMVCDIQNIPSWKEVYLKQHLEEHFKVPVYLSNDANSFAAGEKIYGQGKPFSNLVGITLGSGVGAGIIIDHKLYSGTLSSAGELGGVPYLDKTIEDYCSGKFFAATYSMPGDELYTLAQQGEARALEAYREYGRHLGNALKVVLYLLSPQAIFLGGSISKCFPLFEEAMQQSLATFPYKAVTNQLTISVSALDNAAILGAAALFELKDQHNLQSQTA